MSEQIEATSIEHTKGYIPVVHLSDGSSVSLNELIEQASMWRSAANRAGLWERKAGKIIEQAGAWKRRALAAESDLELAREQARYREGELVRSGHQQLLEAQANALDTIQRIAAQLPTEPIIDAEVVVPDVEVDTWFGEDDTPVVQIDTHRGHGRLRINLNDGVVWDGDPETDERPGKNAELIEWEQRTLAQAETISRQLDTIRDQAEKIEELVQTLKNRNGEGDPADPGAHGGAIPRYGMLDLWQAIRGDAGAGFEEWYDSLGYAEAWSALLVKVRLLRTDLIDARAERDAALRERDALKGRARSWERVYYHPALRQFTEEDGVAVEQVTEGISKLSEWRETIREQYVQAVAERDSARLEAAHLREQLDASSSRGLKIEARFDSVLAKPAQIDAALRIIACGKLTLQDARALVPTDTDPLGVADSERSLREALRLRDEAQQSMRAYITAAADSEEMRKRLDERLANERRVYETTSAALRAMIRERDEVIRIGRDLSKSAAELFGDPAALAQKFVIASNALPKLEAEADARDGGLVDVIRQYDRLAQIGANLARGVRAWGSKLDRINDPELRESVNVAALYEQEHEKLKR